MPYILGQNPLVCNSISEKYWYENPFNG